MRRFERAATRGKHLTMQRQTRSARTRGEESTGNAPTQRNRPPRGTSRRREFKGQDAESAKKASTKKRSKSSPRRKTSVSEEPKKNTEGDTTASCSEQGNEDDDAAVLPATTTTPLTDEDLEQRRKRRLQKKLHKKKTAEAAGSETGSESWPVPLTSQEAGAQALLVAPGYRSPKGGGSKRDLMSVIHSIDDATGPKPTYFVDSRNEAIHRRCRVPECAYKLTASWKQRRGEGAMHINLLHFVTFPTSFGSVTTTFASYA